MPVRPRASRLWFFLLLSVAGVVACAGQSAVAPPAPSALRPGLKGSTPIQHVIIVIQENRSFDNLFATFPNANGTTVGRVEAMPPSLATACPSPITQATTVPLTMHNLVFGDDFQHSNAAYLTALDNGNMDGFDLENKSPGGGYKPSCLYNYAYVDPSQIQPYWTMAQQYVLADNTFQTQGSGSFTAHQDLIAGGTVVNYDTGSCSGSCQNSIVDDPTGFPWGCDARTPNPYGTPPVEGAVTDLITTQLQYLLDKGPYPCLSYKTMRDLLDAKKVSWKFYAPAIQKWSQCGGQGGDTAGIWSAFDAISAVRFSKEWGTKVPGSNLKFFSDIKAGTLPAVAWITPDALNSDHPQEEKSHGQCSKGGADLDYGPSWVAQIVNAVGGSKYWKSTAIVILWDDWGGFYDHVPPPFKDDQGGLGFRIPMLIVSPYVQPHVEHTQYEDASILRFIEDNWSLGSLGTTDQRATAITNAFNFTQTPRPFQPISARYSRSFFLHQKPSNYPADSQ